MNLPTWLGIGSILVGFVLFMTTFASFTLKWGKRTTLAFAVAAGVFLTVVPVTIAIFWATLYVQ